MFRFILLVVLATLLATTEAFRCARCGTYECAPEPPDAQCAPWGKVLDVCNCCTVCAQQLHERCGAQFAGSPKCGRCLKCVKPPLEPGEHPYNQWGACELDCSSKDCQKDPVPVCKIFELSDRSSQ
ncbi:insulin-like growth factor-binding protein 7 [Amphibalanus amphitrite]|uniref:insulin-like growth factor-binding protein 7 n=1 Tax=Amphibalanus amphitrite TaxID=1232801 RepID=UPI001C9286BF|nr:insulin-like growth factor-binding protein 7 [Amphibalanus amphitrite]